MPSSNALANDSPRPNTAIRMARRMTILLVSREPELLRPTKFALEREGLAVIPVVRESEISKSFSRRNIDIMVLDVRLSQTETGKIVERVKGDPRSAEALLILFSQSRAELRKACADGLTLNEVDDVVVEMFDGSDLIDKIRSAARCLKIEKSRYHGDGSGWDDPYAVSSIVERRKDERSSLETPVIMRGKDLLDEPFEEETLMVNVSAGGAYLKSRHHVEDNTTLQISIGGPHVADGTFDLRGTVVRTERGDKQHDPMKRRVAVRFADDVKQSIEFHLLLARMSGAA